MNWQIVLMALLAISAFAWIYAVMTAGKIIKPANRMGKKIADNLQLSKNLVMSILEQSDGSYLMILAAYEKNGHPIDQVTDSLLPSMQQGILALHKRFGDQLQLTDAWDKIQERMTERGL